MPTILIILLCIFLGLALLVFVLERFAKPMDRATVARLSAWLIPLIGFLLVLRILEHYVFGS